MSEKPEPTPSRSQLREEAANWFAIMRGPDAEAHQEEFDRWLARGALHRRAYNSVAETFNLGKLLKEERSLPSGGESGGSDEGTNRSSGRRLKSLLAVVVAGGIGLSCIALIRHHGQTPAPRSLETVSSSPASRELAARYSTGTGDTKSFALADGSKLALGANSLILVSFTATDRELHLVRGRARFFVAHDGRPFRVVANQTTVIAKGTVFDVALLDRQHVAVHLIKGAIDVTGPAPRTNAANSNISGSSLITHMTSGQNLVFDNSSGTISKLPAVEQQGGPNSVIAFDDTSLAELVNESNKHAHPPIVLGDASLGSLRISGTFDLRDARHTAEQIADFLSLAVIYSDSDLMLARRCPAEPAARCRPPS